MKQQNTYMHRLISAHALLFLTFWVMLAAPGPAHAGGNRELNEFRMQQAELFEKSVADLAAGRMSAREIQMQMEELRLAYRIPYSDEAGILDALIDGIHEGRITGAEGLLFYTMLDDGSLSRYRRAARLEQNEAKKRRILSDLQDFMNSDGILQDAASLQNYLNNLYRLTGMEYDLLYGELSALIEDFGARELDRNGFLAGLQRLAGDSISGSAGSGAGDRGEPPGDQGSSSSGSPLRQEPLPGSPETTGEDSPPAGTGSGGGGQRSGGS